MMYINAYIIPTIITIIVLVGIIEKKDVYDLFCSGAKEGITITVKMFPILIGIFLAVGMMKNSGLLEEISRLITPIIMRPEEIDNGNYPRTERQACRRQQDRRGSRRRIACKD